MDRYFNNNHTRHYHGIKQHNKLLAILGTPIYGDRSKSLHAAQNQNRPINNTPNSNICWNWGVANKRCIGDNTSILHCIGTYLLNLTWVGISVTLNVPTVTASSEITKTAEVFTPVTGSTTGTTVGYSVRLALLPSVTPQTITFGGAGTLPSSGSSVTLQVSGSN